MGKKRSISRTFLMSMILATIVPIALLGALWTWQQYATFQEESGELREMMMNSYKDLLKIQVERSVDYIEFRKSLTEERLRSSIRERVYEAHSLAAHLQEKWKTQKPDDEIRMLIKETLRPLRFNDGRGYFFILDLAGINRLMPVRPELENTDMLAPSDSDEAMAASEILRLAAEKREGFCRYDWPKPGRPESSFPKISFVKRFEPYQWIIGAGEYLDDFQAGIQREVLNYLGTIRFGKDGYVFVTQWDGLDLTGPAKGRNMLEVTDVNGVKIVQKLIELAKSGGGFLRYVMPKFEGTRPEPKLSYVQGVRDWQWYVGAGIYIDDIEKAIAAKRAQMTREVVKSLLQIAAVLLALVVFAFFYARRTSRNAQDGFDLFAVFFDRGARESAVIDPEAMTYEEFSTLAHSANRMIEARRQAQAALKESERNYRLIVENVNDLIVKMDLEKNLTFISPNYCELFGKTADEIRSRGFLPLILEADHEEVIRSLRVLDHPPYTSYHEERALTKSGPRWLAWSSRAILDESGLPVEYVAVGRDITEKKLAEEALRENREWLKNILDSIQAGVVVIDPETHVILDLNRAAAEMIGEKKERIVDTICHNHICPNEIGNCPVTDRGLKIEQADRELLRADGSKIPILKTVNRATINGKQYLIESFLDLSEKRRLETMLLQAQKMEAIGTLAGGIAHDFNNILSGIIGYAELALVDTDAESPMKSYLDQILGAGYRARDLVSQILVFSRQQEGEQKPIKVGSLLREAFKLLRASIPANIEIKIDHSTPSDTVMADPTQVHQLIMNLSTNAAHAMRKKGGILHVSVEEVHLDSNSGKGEHELEGGPFVRMRFKDTGEGIRRDHLVRIFDPFFTTKERGAGTGLGLALVHGIVKNHGGAVTVESEPGRGTVFTIYLPRIEIDGSKKTIVSQELLPRGTERILFVDDEPSIAELGENMLGSLGYSVVSMTSSLDALEAFRAQPFGFDLVITDQAMPNMTGKELAKALMAVRPDIPIILCTGFSEQIDEKKAKAMGIGAFVMKPIVMRQIARRIREVLESSKPG
jgi:PAS domain S-box-containing protein